MVDSLDQAEVGRVWFGPGDPLHLRVPHLLSGRGKPKQDPSLRRPEQKGIRLPLLISFCKNKCNCLLIVICLIILRAGTAWF
jgi:hypothetical protein